LGVTGAMPASFANSSLRSRVSLSALPGSVGLRGPGTSACTASLDFCLNEPKTLLGPRRRAFGKDTGQAKPGVLQPQRMVGETRQVIVEPPFVGTRRLPDELSGEFVGQRTHGADWFTRGWRPAIVLHRRSLHTVFPAPAIASLGPRLFTRAAARACWATP